MTKNIPTVTIGIPAYNEEANIAFLLRSILRQNMNRFKLERIIVNCDGCTDNTVSRAKGLAKKHPIIKVINNPKNKGKTARLNQLYQLNTSDILIYLDGDIILETNICLQNLIIPFQNPKTILVSANNQPVSARTFIERVYISGFRLWYEIRQNYKGGDNVHNIHGCAVALRKDFAKSFSFPEKQPTSDSGFVYMMARKMKGEFHFAKNAIVRFRSTSNIKDLTLQGTRNLDTRNKSTKFFGSSALDEYKISKTAKAKGILIALLKDPIFTPLAVIMNLTLRLLPKDMFNSPNTSTWKISKSTKTVI